METQTFIKHWFLKRTVRQQLVDYESQYSMAEQWILDNFTIDNCRFEYWREYTLDTPTVKYGLVTSWVDKRYYAENIAFANEEDFLMFKLKFGSLLSPNNTPNNREF